MKRVIRYLRGFVILEFCGASPGWVLNYLAEERIAFWDVEWLDELTIRVKVFRGKESIACNLAQKAMCDWKIICSAGLYLHLEQCFHRPVLVFMAFLSVMSALVLPCFLFFVEVEGNDAVPEQIILRELEQAGVPFGIYGPKIYPKQVKDRLIEVLPKLQWATVEQHGCRGTVVVREREDIPETVTKKGFANIVAGESGVITQQSVYTGQALFQVGDTVNRGDVLVSGIVDLERTYLIERANAEIFARTWRRIPACIPSRYTKRVKENGQRRCFWLLVGRKRIKLFGNSGISYGSCDKMISTKTVTLPKGLTLPLALEIETFSSYEVGLGQISKELAEKLLSDYALSAVKAEMYAGEILGQQYKLSEKNGCYRLDAVMECHEMIARVVEAKWNNEEVTND